MQRKKLFSIVAAGLFILAASIGFYSVNDNNQTGTPFSTGYQPIGNTQSVPQINYQPDLLTPAWTSGTAIPLSCSFGAGATYTRNDTIWLFALSNTPPATTTQIYNARTNTWSNGAALLTAVDRTCACVLRDSLYILGGDNTGGVSINTVQRYDIRGNAWTTRANLPSAMGWGKAVGYQDSLIYFIGGNDGANSVANLWLYNALTNTWRTGTSLPAARFGGGLALSGDTLVYVGGADNALLYNTTYKGLISQSNRGTVTWTTGAPIPAAFGSTLYRCDLAPWGCKGVILATGSATTAFTGVNAVASYSPGADAWTTQPNNPTASCYAPMGSGKMTGNIWKLIISGGYNNAFLTNTNILTDTLCLPPLPSLCEEFLTATFPPTGWTGTTNGIYPWAYNAASGFGVGTGSARARMYLAPVTETEILTSLAFAPVPSQTGLFVDMAYAEWTSGLARPDSLVIFSSTNGGTTYTTLASLGYTEMETTAPVAGEFLPTASQWAKRIYALPTGTNMVQFYYHSGFGNNLFLDSICTGSIVGISNNGGVIPHSYALSQNYPNPFNPSTVIKYSLPKAGLVKLVVFDILGREVRTLVNEIKTAGIYSVNFDASSLASGVYFYRVESGDFVQTKKMLLIK
jgi:hypothetical protein